MTPRLPQLREDVADAITFHPANRTGTPEQRHPVSLMLADTVLRVVRPCTCDGDLIECSHEAARGQAEEEHRQLRAERDVLKAAVEQLRYERRLLGWARMTLDLVAAGDPTCWERARREAEDIAQRIVDEIGHPVTDEPALGPGFRAAIERTREAMERYAAAGCTTVNVRQVINLLSLTYPDGNYETTPDAPTGGED